VKAKQKAKSKRKRAHPPVVLPSILLSDVPPTEKSITEPLSPHNRELERIREEIQSLRTKLAHEGKFPPFFQGFIALFFQMDNNKTEIRFSVCFSCKTREAKTKTQRKTC
jgi:hypothetical protein